MYFYYATVLEIISVNKVELLLDRGFYDYKKTIIQLNDISSPEFFKNREEKIQNQYVLKKLKEEIEDKTVLYQSIRLSSKNFSIGKIYIEETLCVNDLIKQWQEESQRFKIQ